MANIDLEIGGRRFAVSVQPGEERHIELLGRMIDSRVRDANAVGQSEPRMLLYGALMLADEVHNLREGEKDPVVQQAEDREADKAQARAADKALAQRVDAITARIENIVRHLEGEARSA